MTRRSKREIEAALEELEEETDPTEECDADPLTPAEKEFLAEEYDVDWEEGEEMWLTDILLDDDTEDA